MLEMANPMEVATCHFFPPNFGKFNFENGYKFNLFNILNDKFGNEKVLRFPSFPSMPWARAYRVNPPQGHVRVVV